jgi:hypothetical protein
LITHENLTHFHMPQVIKNADCDKPCIDKATTSMGTDKGIIKVKYATTDTTKHNTTSRRPNISVAHAELVRQHLKYSSHRNFHQRDQIF